MEVTFYLMKDKSAVTSAHQIFISAIDGLLRLARLAFNSPLNPKRFTHKHVVVVQSSPEGQIYREQRILWISI